uniref:Uncharacterized protein n=1 Tax=Pyxicephalus adspersus TaxID=30357 RepID=A0AAV3AKK6_PYXAD|nr:TPA: hypothetical protein GDO54_010093 [Pyxicephalus adspersus]
MRFETRITHIDNDYYECILYLLFIIGCLEHFTGVPHLMTACTYNRLSDWYTIQDVYSVQQCSFPPLFFLAPSSDPSTNSHVTDAWAQLSSPAPYIPHLLKNRIYIAPTYYAVLYKK